MNKIDQYGISIIKWIADEMQCEIFSIERLADTLVNVLPKSSLKEKKND